MNSNYVNDLRLFDEALQTLLSIVRCKEYLFSIDNIDLIEQYEQFALKVDGDYYMFSAHMNFVKDDVWIELTSGSLDTSIKVAHNNIEFYTLNTEYIYVTIFSVNNALDIKDEESFFQASTLHDLSSVQDGEKWFQRVVKNYSEIAYIVEID